MDAIAVQGDRRNSLEPTVENLLFELPVEGTMCLMGIMFRMGCSLVFAVVLPAFSWGEFTARVIAVHEGDRLSVYHQGRTETIRLRGIVSPHLNQPYGLEAKRALQAYVGGRDVVIRAVRRDRHGRTTADVVLLDGRNVAYEMVKEGLAWSHGETAEGQSLADQEELARAAGKGLWADPHPVPPWKWKAPKTGSPTYFNSH